MLGLFPRLLENGRECWKNVRPGLVWIEIPSISRKLMEVFRGLFRNGLRGSIVVQLLMRLLGAWAGRAG
jgi:hypothetical protein